MSKTFMHKEQQRIITGKKQEHGLLLHNIQDYTLASTAISILRPKIMLVSQQGCSLRYSS